MNKELELYINKNLEISKQRKSINNIFQSKLGNIIHEEACFEKENNANILKCCVFRMA